LLNKRANPPRRFESFIFRLMTTTVDILDTVLLNLRIEDGMFIASLGDSVVEVDNLRRDGDGNVWVTYFEDGESKTVLKYEAKKEKRREW
jgi:hypothetical protein